MICACSHFGTGCSATTSQTFAIGHDSKLRKILVDALVAGDPVTRDGLPVDPWLIAQEFNMTHHVDYFLQATLAKNAVLAARQAEREAAQLERERLRQEALDIRATRESERQAARDLANQARARLVATAEQRTREYLDGFNWEGEDPSTLMS